MKHIIISGRLTADPQIKVVGTDNKKVANFSIANNDNNKEKPEFFDVVAWGKSADFVEQYLTKGKKVFIQGSFSNEEYTANNTKKIHFIVNANSIEFGESQKQ
ncbi:MAG: single-stranded DNA-binding protein [Oscillospiraceae bacterium]